jgi:hypothetical protein
MVLGYPEHGVRFGQPAADFAAWATACGEAIERALAFLRGQPHKAAMGQRPEPANEPALQQCSR